jgi:hypothetical protein
MFIKAAEGLRIVDPDMNDFLPADGREVPDTPYWHRMKLAGDVVEAVPIQTSVQPTSTSKISRAAAAS